jgi:hypothetical protein
MHNYPPTVRSGAAGPVVLALQVRCPPVVPGVAGR